MGSERRRWLEWLGEWLTRRLEELEAITTEDNLDVIRGSDWIIDLGSDGGGKGGVIVVLGTPEEVAAHFTSHTARHLKQVPKQHTPEVLAA